MKKLIFISLVWCFFALACSVHHHYEGSGPDRSEESVDQIRAEAKRNAEEFHGHTQVYFSEDHEWLFIDLSIDDERGNHVTNLDNEHRTWNKAKIKKAKFHILMEVNGKRICRREPIGEIDERRNLIRLKFSTKLFKKKLDAGKKVDF